jgi:hypothetical protein
MAIETFTKVGATFSNDDNYIEKLFNTNKVHVMPSLFKKITAVQSSNLSLRTMKQPLQKSIPNS